MREYLYLLEPNRPGMIADGPTDDESAVLEEHFAWLEDLAEAGTVELAGRTTSEDPTEALGLVVFRADDDATAEALVRADPAVSSGLMRARWYPFRIAIQAADV